MKTLIALALVLVGQMALADRVCVFEDIDYGGRSLCMPVGTNIDNLIRQNWDHRISSITIEGTAVVDLYEAANYIGAIGRVNYSLHDLRGINFNDRAVSIKTYVPEGRACFFLNDNFQGGYRCFFPGDNIGNLVPLNYNDQISSIWLVGNVSVLAYENIGFGGGQIWVRKSTPSLNFDFPGWNDRISSFQVIHATGR